MKWWERETVGSKSKGIQKAQQEYEIAKTRGGDVAKAMWYLTRAQRVWFNRRELFIKRYNANAMNFLPGDVQRDLYRLPLKQAELERAANLELEMWK